MSQKVRWQETLRITPVAGLGRVVGAAPDVAIALGYDIAVAMDDLEDP